MSSPRPVIVLGAGGHALVCIEVLRSCGVDVIGSLSKDGQSTTELGVPMLGTTDDLERILAEHGAGVFVGVGNNRTRQELTHLVDSAGGSLVDAVSPHAIVSPTATVERGALIMPGAVVNARANIGVAAIVNTRAAVDHECSIGAWAHIGPGVAMAGNVEIGDGALVGVGACVTPGRTIGAWSIVGAGSAVVRDVPSGATVAGVPAKTTYGSALYR